MAEVVLFADHKLVARKVGPVFAMVRFAWSAWAVGFELIPWGAILYIGPLSLGCAHFERYTAAIDAEKQPT